MREKLKNISKKSAYLLSVAVVGLVVGVSMQFVRAWTGPNATAPDGTVNSPVLTKPTLDQAIDGNLIINKTLHVKDIIVDQPGTGSITLKNSKITEWPTAGGANPGTSFTGGQTSCYDTALRQPDWSGVKCNVGYYVAGLTNTINFNDHDVTSATCCKIESATSYGCPYNGVDYTPGQSIVENTSGCIATQTCEEVGYFSTDQGGGCSWAYDMGPQLGIWFNGNLSTATKTCQNDGTMKTTATGTGSCSNATRTCWTDAYCQGN